MGLLLLVPNRSFIRGVCGVAPAVLCKCGNLTMPARQVLAKVVAQLPRCEAVRLQRVSQ